MARVVVHDYAGHAFAVQLSRELAHRGHEVLHLYSASLMSPHGALGDDRNDPESLTIEPITLDRVIDKSALVRRRSLEIAYGRQLASRIAEYDPDTVLSANTPLDSQVAVIRLCERSRIRFVNWVQDAYGTAAHRLLRRRLGMLGSAVGRYYIRMERRQLRQSSHIVLITDDFLPICNAARLPRERVEVIENWAALQELPQRQHDNQWARRFSLEGTFNFIYSGTLGMKHDPKLLAALARHVCMKADVRVVVVSEGDGAEYLKSVSQTERLENILVLPFQEHNSLPDVLGSADVLIAILEPDAGMFSVPSKVLSYLCAGRALLLSVPMANLAARIVVENNAGIVVNPGDRGAFTDAADRLMSDAQLRGTYGELGRRYAEETFDIGRITDRFESALALAT